MVVDVDAADVAELMGRAHDETDHAGGFDRALIEHARAMLPTWFEVTGDGVPCPLVVDLASPRSPRAIRVSATARCGGRPAEIALRWRAAGRGSTLSAAGTLVHRDGTRADVTFDAASPSVLVRVRARDGFPWVAVIAAAAILFALLLSRRRPRGAG